MLISHVVQLYLVTFRSVGWLCQRCKFYDKRASLLATAFLVGSDISCTQMFHHFRSQRAQKAPTPPRELFLCLSMEPFIISYLVRHFGKYNLLVTFEHWCVFDHNV